MDEIKLQEVTPHAVFRSLQWVEDVVWDLTGLPDIFVSLLAQCSYIGQDSDNRPEYATEPLEILNLVRSADSKYDTDGPSMVEAAIKQAKADEGFAMELACLCNTYYFLRSMKSVFSLDEQEFDGLVGQLRPDRNADAPLHTHADALGSLNLFLDKLEPKYPGIRHYASCIMLEANVVKEYGTTYEYLHGLRSQLPPDGDLYMATLRSIIESVHQNATVAQTMESAHALYENALPDYWTAASNGIWDIIEGGDGEVEAEIDYDEPLDAVGPATPQSRTVSVAPQ
ncbi:hypothetical protein GGF46_000293 [Coemansia sp. RSA 552]|nr:hypothetical protein GGF46_000293 [Coemansia sp. RSA 552]